MRMIQAIASKSDAHRALLANFLAGDTAPVKISTTSLDIEATRDCLLALRKGKKDLYPKESGSTFRFLLPVVAALGKSVCFHLEGRLPLRPLSPLYEALEAHGVTLSAQGTKEFCSSGALQGGTFTLAGNVSSQFISGLLFALPLLREDSHLHIVGTLESAGYVDMTLQTLLAFGIQIEKQENGFFIRGRQVYHRAAPYIVEGDWSNAAYFLAAGAVLQDGLCVSGLSQDSAQGDKAILSCLLKFGASVTVAKDIVSVKAAPLQGITLDTAQIPDLVPILALLAAFAVGETVLQNVGRLRLKESDRLKSICAALSALGVQTSLENNNLHIYGTGTLHGGTVDSYGDHRIVMLAAIASLVTKEPVRILGATAVQKSYPNFFSDLAALQLRDNIERM